MTTSTKPLVSPSLIARGFGSRRGDFEVYTGAAVADEGTDLPIVRMVGSSTVQDLQGDIMTLSALQDMANGNPELTIFLNHEYNVPDDVFGKLYGKPEVRMKGSIADLHLAAVADLSRDEGGRYPHSKAYDTYTQIKKGKIRLGSSVGCQVTEYQFLDPDDFWSGILIEHVVWVEHSIVGVPASQRAWVEQAVKGLFERALMEGRADDARSLAPAMKSMYWRDYDTVLHYLESDGLRKDLERVRERGAARERIMFDYKLNSFRLDRLNDTSKSLTLEEVDTLIEQAALSGEDVDSTKTVCGKTSWPLMDIGTEWTGSKAESAIFAYAKGDDGEIAPSKASQGFLYRDAAKDPKLKGAYKMPFCYGGDGGLKIVPLGVRACANVLNGGMGGVHASDEDKSGMRGKCKTMYGRINSEFHPDPKWVVPWESKEDSAADFYTTEMAFMQALGFAVIEQGNTFYVKNADGTLTPWLSKSESGVLDSTTGEELVRQDLGEQPSGDKNKAGVPQANDVAIGNDGTHPLCKGTHTHIHPAYGGSDNDGDGKHSHEHTHDGDAQHSHSHAEKHGAPATRKADVTVNDDGSHEKMTGSHSHAHTAYGQKADGSMHTHDHEHTNDHDHHHSHADQKGLTSEELDGDGNHAPFTGTHTHKHKSFGNKADGSMHSHEHDHDGDTNHAHSHALKSLTRAIDTDEDGNHAPFTGTHTHAHKAFGANDDDGDGMHSHAHDHDGDSKHSHPHADEKSLDPVRLAKLSLYNSLGHELGFPEHTFTTKCDLVATQGDAGIVRSTLAALDDCSDAMMRLSQQADSYVDSLMSMMGVSDVNDGGELDGDDGGGTSTTPYNPFPGMYSATDITRKEGRVLNAANRGLVQTIHDACMALHPDCCKAQVATVEEAQEEARQMGQGDSYSNLAMWHPLEALTKALEGLSIKNLEGEVNTIKAAIIQARTEQAAIMEQVGRLKNMPLGRPTNLQRTVVPSEHSMAIDNIATYQDLLSVSVTPVQTLQEALSHTRIVEKQLLAENGKTHTTKMRLWPKGVGIQVRPELTNDQKMFMGYDDWFAYRDGSRDVAVPLVDDPAQLLS